MGKEILVSVYMLCYNHALYIEQAIESILSQKTNFKFELVIHDDASTDASAEIIKKYEHLYPEIVKPIYQTINQYSKGIDIVKEYIEPLLRGEYVAICEGDDYWCDDNKLQKQIDYLETHESMSATTHNCYMIDENGIPSTIKRNTYPLKKDYIYSLFDYAVGSAYPGQTASLVYRKSAMNFKTAEQEVACDNLKTNGDTKVNMRLLLAGNIFHMSDIMSVHRVVTGNSSSWTASSYGKNRSYELFLLSIEMRSYIKKYYNITFWNYYKTFHAGVACIFKYKLKRNDDNERVYREACNLKNGALNLFLYLSKLALVSIPLGVLHKIFEKKYLIES